MRPQWFAALWCRWFGHRAEWLTANDEDVMPFVCDRCLLLGEVRVVWLEVGE